MRQNPFVPLSAISSADPPAFLSGLNRIKGSQITDTAYLSFAPRGIGIHSSRPFDLQGQIERTDADCLVNYENCSITSCIYQISCLQRLEKQSARFVFYGDKNGKLY